MVLDPVECLTSKGKGYLTPVTISRAPATLVKYLRECFNLEVDAANTYPHNQHMDDAEFAMYWFGYTAIVLLRDAAQLSNDRDWQADVLGTYYIKPNYLGHCSHICNAGFLVPMQHRGGKHGKVLARSFAYFASRLRYRSSVFNLVFETNEASTRLWDQHGYKRVGRIEEAIEIQGKWTAAIVYQGNFLDGSIDTNPP